VRTKPIALALILAVSAASTSGAQIAPPRCPTPTECPIGRPRPLPAPQQRIERTFSDVRVTLEGSTLRYVLTERFINRGAGIGEADYLLPLPRGAAFEELALTIDGEPVTGQTLDALKARGIYEQIVREARDPALVEWMDHDLFRTRIFPIAPGEERTVVVRFAVVARREGAALRIEHVAGGRSAGSVQAVAPPTFTLVVANAARYGTPYSPTHRLDVSERAGRREVTVRGDASRLTLLLPVRSSDRAVITPLLHAPGGEDAFMLLTVTPPSGRPRAVARDVTLVLDVSGSMAGSKLVQAKAAGRAVLGTLSPTDRVRMIAFSSDVQQFRSDWQAATGATIAAGERWLDALEAVGGTNIEAALQSALDVRVPASRLGVVLFLTDGAATVGERDAATLAHLAAATRGAQRVFTFGVGADVQAAMLERIAIEGRGTAQFVQPNEDVEHVVGVVAQRLTAPVITDLRVRGAGMTLRQVMPAAGIDVFAGQDVVVLARVRGTGQATVIVEGETPSGPVRWTQAVTIPVRSREHAYVAKLWAVQRVGWLSAERRRAGASTELDDELRSLGTKYGIPTELSSYLVLEPGMVIPSSPPADFSGRGVAGGRVATTEFNAAKAASAQRAATSLADAAPPTVAGGGTLRVVGDRTFTLRDGRWTDGRLRDGVRRVVIAPYSAAYFALRSALPELGAVFALGDSVTVAGRSVVLVLETEGVEHLDASAVAAVVRDW